MSRVDCVVRHRVARWNPEFREFELQCPSCRAQSKQSYWPLTLEFWSPRTLSTCRACRMQADRARQRGRRLDAAVRARDVAKTAAWRKANPGYGTPTTRAWRAANRERDRATTNARNAARRAAAA